MGSMQEVGNNCLTPSDTVMIQLKQLEDQLKDKERELRAAHNEIKAMKQTESLKDRALMELSNKLKKMDEKLTIAEKYVEAKNLEIKKLSKEKKEALAGQFAAEATLKRVHATQEDEEFFPVEAVIAPLESEIKKYKKENLRLQEDKKALQRIIKSKEAALIEAQQILHSALERVLIVENVQNQNLELRRQIEICQDENKFLNKIHRQKVVEVEKLTATIHELEESILVHAATGNTIRDYQCQVSQLNDEKRTLGTELARARVSVNRVAARTASEWKDENNGVMLVNKCFEERKCLQGEIFRLREKLTISERTGKAEAQLKEKLRLRLNTVEEGLKNASDLSVMKARSFKQGGMCSNNPKSIKQSIFPASTTFSPNKASILQQNNLKNGNSVSNRITKQADGLNVNVLTTKNLSAAKRQSFDGNGEENAVLQVESGGLKDNDSVSGFLYDRLQKEVIYLRKSLEGKERLLKAKDDEIKMLFKKVDALTKATERELKRVKKEVMGREKDAIFATKKKTTKKVSIWYYMILPLLSFVRMFSIFSIR